MSTKTFSQDDMALALFEVEQFFERMPGTKMVLLGDTAKAVRDGYFLDEPLTVGIRKQELTRPNQTTLEHFLPELQEVKGGYTGKFRNVPVMIKIFKNDYEFIKNSDQVVFRGGYYHVPNQWEKYWKMRNLLV